MGREKASQGNEGGGVHEAGYEGKPGTDHGLSSSVRGHDASASSAPNPIIALHPHSCPKADLPWVRKGSDPAGLAFVLAAPRYPPPASISREPRGPATLAYPDKPQLQQQWHDAR